MTEYRDGRVSLQVLSHSRTAVSRDCPAKYGYRYVDGLRPKVEKDPTRLRGRGMHEGFEAGYRMWRELRLRNVPTAVVDPIELIRASAQETCHAAHEKVLEELAAARQGGAPVEVCDEVLERLVESHEADMWALGHFFDVVVPRDYARKTPIFIEHEFEVPILDAAGRARHLRWNGYLDCVMYDEKLRVLELHEQKTVGTNAGSDEHRRRIEGDPQTTSYVYALRELQKRGALDAALLAIGVLDAQMVPIGTVVVNVIRRKKPSEPKTLADGTISTDRRIDTLPEVYEAALAAQAEPEALAKASATLRTAEEDAERLRAAYAKADEEGARARAAYEEGGASFQETQHAQPPKKLEREVEQAKKRVEKAYEALTKKRAAWATTQAKQRELLDALRQRGDTFIAEHEQFVTERECERWRSEQWVAAERIRRIEKRPAERTRNLGFCTAPGRGCTYRTLCYSGGDEQIRSMEFTTPEERERMQATEAAEEEEREEPDEPVEAPPYSAPAWG